MRYLRTLSLNLAISILGHIALLLLCLYLVPSTPKTDVQNLTEVDLMEKPELPRRPKQESTSAKDFVRAAQAPQDLLSNEKHHKQFASDREQDVIEEQQARKSGLTANRSELPKTEHAGPDRKATNRKKLDFKPTPIEQLAESRGELQGDTSISGYKNKGSSTDGKPLDFSRFGNIERGTSTIGEQLPSSIKLGDFTSLNTDRHLYYTFYSRIEEMIRGRWVNYIKATVFGMENGTVVIPNSRNWTTKVEVVLDARGNFLKAILHESSGSRNLDSAPVQAFRDVHQIPNPPAELVKEDGTIRLLYAFSVNIIPSYAAGDQAE
jgi:TonB family protein